MKRPPPGRDTLSKVQAVASATGARYAPRVALYLSVLAVITAAHSLVVTLVRALIDQVHPLHLLATPAGRARIVATLLLCAFALVARRPRLGKGPLFALEALASLVVATSGLIGVPNAPLETRPEITVLLATSLVLVLRAALVPSRPRRTLGIGLMTLAPFTVAHHAYPATYLAGGVPMREIALATVLIFGALLLAVTTFVSHAIFTGPKRREVGPTLGPYELERKLGEGGMGTVYQARHRSLGRRTALKLVKPGPVDDAATERFEREARVLGELSHPNCVTLYDYGQTDDGVYYFAMELVDGITLDELLRREGALSPRRTIHLLRQVAAGLAHAHGKQLVHRDVKPSNVMICERAGHADLVKLLDFGLAKSLVDPCALSRSSWVGTPLFMAPEAVYDRDAAGPAADVYAVGLLGYALLTGTCLFEDHSATSLPRAHLLEPPLPPSLRASGHVPRDLEDVLLRCLAKAPGERFADGAALLAAFEACAMPADERRSATPRTETRSHRREREVSTVAG
jgi:serine/threonine-protein kinase